VTLFFQPLFSVCFVMLATADVSPYSAAEDSSPISATASTPALESATAPLHEQIHRAAQEMDMEPMIRELRNKMDQVSGNGDAGNDRDQAEIDSGSGLDFSLFLWLTVLVGVILGCGWLLRRLMGTAVRRTGGQIRVLASCPLSQRSRLYIVEVGAQRFLIGEGGGTVSFISSLPPSPDIHSDDSMENDQPAETVSPVDSERSTFADRLRQWEQSVGAQNVSGEVRASLRFLETLSRRLRRNPDANRGGPNPLP